MGDRLIDYSPHYSEHLIYCGFWHCPFCSAGPECLDSSGGGVGVFQNGRRFTDNANHCSRCKSSWTARTINKPLECRAV